FQLLPEMGLFGGVSCVLAIGFERLVAVIYILLISAYCLYAAYLIIASYEPGREICSIPTPFHGAAAGRFAQTLLISNALTAVVYSAVGAALLTRSSKAATTRRAFRCLFIVMVFDVGGWALSIGFLNLTHVVKFTAETRFIMRIVAGIFVNAGIASKPIIYYAVRFDF
ncbi:hypothetical protein PFISCL1PPCAC_13967, partial [Pristionchus fissidentatus]